WFLFPILWQIITKVLLIEPLPSLVQAVTLTMINLIGYSAMAGMVGGGGLGKVAIQYGYNRFDLFIPLQAGLSPLKDALIREDSHSMYANIIAVRTGEENRQELQELKKAMTSDKMRAFILENYKGAIVPAF